MIFDPILDIFRGKAITIPPLDGAFRANTALDDAAVWTDLADADNLAVAGDSVIASSGPELCALDADGGREVLHRYPAAITALAVAADGSRAVALEGGALWIGDAQATLPAAIGCITALAFGADGGLWLANGSSRHPASGWVVDLMQKNALGSVWKGDAGGHEFRKVAGGLAYPYGLLPEPGAGGVIVSESWRHRLIRIDPQTGQSRALLSHLPGYPARLTPAAGGGAWLSIFAPRNRLIELVLQERHYRYDMMASVPREFWIAPALASGNSFLEPLQCGGIRIMGIHKPWSPSRSYGLVVRLDADMTPVASLHSRANGARHGTCSAVEHDGRLLVAAKGGGVVLSLDPAAETGAL